MSDRGFILPIGWFANYAIIMTYIKIGILVVILGILGLALIIGWIVGRGT